MFSNCNKDKYINDKTFPYAPEIFIHDTIDNGFCKGWGMHFHSIPAYWYDCHVHYWVQDKDIIGAMVNHFQTIYNYGVRKMAVMPPIPNLAIHGDANDKTLFSHPRELNPHLTLEKKNKDISWMIYLEHTTPDPSFVEEAYREGASCVKLHNGPLIRDGSDRRVWFTEEWDKTFKAIEKCGLPVLTHVTQRLAKSEYKPGSENAFFKDGWENGVTYTNEDLLLDFLLLLKKYPGINFVGAHELFLGIERLGKLFDLYPNLFIDTSGGFLVREYDVMYERDRTLYNEFFVRYRDRILFGTDAVVTTVEPDNDMEAIYKDRIRFIMQLRLPYDVLQDVAYKNAERLFNSTVGLNEATIKKYIQDQEKHDIMVDKLSVKEYEDPFKG